MHIIGWIIFGLIVGAVSRFLMPGPQPMGLIKTGLLGIGGSFVGGTIVSALRGGSITEPVAAGWIGAVLGALLILFIYGRMVGRRI
jgi:uncharacterized membrane protein YeaQ/YmgE (transglycosylase-associated protein family)